MTDKTKDNIRNAVRAWSPFGILLLTIGGVILAGGGKLQQLDEQGKRLTSVEGEVREMRDDLITTKENVLWIRRELEQQRQGK